MLSFSFVIRMLSLVDQSKPKNFKDDDILPTTSFAMKLHHTYLPWTFFIFAGLMVGNYCYGNSILCKTDFDPRLADLFCLGLTTYVEKQHQQHTEEIPIRYYAWYPVLFFFIGYIFRLPHNFFEACTSKYFQFFSKGHLSIGMHHNYF